MLLLEFTVKERRYALPLDSVERTFQAVEVTPVEEEDSDLLGVVNVQGEVLPVISLRRRLGHGRDSVRLTDRLVVAMNQKHRVALLVDSVIGVVDVGEDTFVSSEDVYPGMVSVSGISKQSDGLLMVGDLDHFVRTPDIGSLVGIPKGRECADATV